MIAVDTNLLVYASRADVPQHARALQAVLGLANGDEPWAIAWPCVHEFLATVTRPRYFDPPTPVAQAVATMEAWFGSRSLTMIGEGRGYYDTLI